MPPSKPAVPKSLTEKRTITEVAVPGLKTNVVCESGLFWLLSITTAFGITRPESVNVTFPGTPTLPESLLPSPTKLIRGTPAVTPLPNVVPPSSEISRSITSALVAPDS